VVGPPGHGAAVLIRAVEPVDGEGYMAQNRHGQSGVQLTNGPAKLCQALSIDKALNGHNLQSKPLELIPRPALPITDIIQTTRIGISQAADTPWRYYERGNQYVSRP
jgi:DNA-3-methyladenine glycosylase